MHIKGKENQPEEYANISIEGTNLEKVKDFKYLGSIKSENGNCKADVKSRIGMTKQKNATAKQHLEGQRHAQKTEAKNTEMSDLACRQVLL